MYWEERTVLCLSILQKLSLSHSINKVLLGQPRLVDSLISNYLHMTAINYYVLALIMNLCLFKTGR